MTKILLTILTITPIFLMGQQWQLIDSKTFGDSLRIEIRTLNDTILKKFIDLKGISDDNFDGTFETLLFYTVRQSKDSLLFQDDPLIFEHGPIKFTFRKKDILAMQGNDLRPYTDSSPKFAIVVKKESLQKLQEDIKAGTSFDFQTYKRLLPELLKRLDFHLSIKGYDKVLDKVRIEQYETGFSGGHNLQLIEENYQDTLRIMKINDWMN